MPEELPNQIQRPAWYCTEKHFGRLIKWSLNSDRGNLEVSSDRIRFSGKKSQLDCRGITGVALTGIYWPSLVALAIGDALILLAMFGGLFSFFTLDNAATPIMLLAINLFALAAWPLRWVHVEYRDENNNLAHAYFSDGSALGKNLGGTRRLEALIRQMSMKGT